MSNDKPATTALDEALARKVLPTPEECQRIREAAGLSRQRLGRDIGVSGQSIAFYETGKRTPRGDHLVRYVDLLANLAHLAEVL